MRVLVCGGRDFNSPLFLDEVLWWRLRHDDKYKPITIIHGGAKGADKLAGEWGERFSCKVEVYPADWDKYGKRAGPIRNQQMIDEGKPDLVIAFPGGRGTADMVSKAKKAGIPVEEVTYPE